jgi:transcriptional regulator with XRE-family HTH domain
VAASNELSELILSSMTNREILQKEIARTCGVNESTVTRWLYDHTPPIIMLAMLRTDPRLLPLGLDILRYLEALYGRQVMPAGKVFKLDGNIKDELLDAVSIEGRLAELKDQDPSKASELIDALMEICARMKAEISKKQA